MYEELEALPAGRRSCGWAAEYHKDGRTIYVLVAERHGGHAFVELAGRTFERMTRDDTLMQLNAIVVALANVTRAVGGLGTFEPPFAPVTLHDVVHNVGQTPDEPAVPALLALISTEEMEERSACTLPHYTCQPAGGYWLLEHDDFRS